MGEDEGEFFSWQRKFYLGGGGSIFICVQNFLGYTHLIEVQQSFMALEGVSAVWNKEIVTKSAILFQGFPK